MILPFGAQITKENAAAIKSKRNIFKRITENLPQIPDYLYYILIKKIRNENCKDMTLKYWQQYQFVSDK